MSEEEKELKEAQQDFYDLHSYTVQFYNSQLQLWHFLLAENWEDLGDGECSVEIKSEDSKSGHPHTFRFKKSLVD